MTRRLPSKYKWKFEPTKMVGSTNLRIEPLTIISEPGFYRAVMGSKKEEAEAFQDWVCEEVLPTIRKHGFYGTPETIDHMLSDPDAAILMLKAYKQEKLAKEKALEERDHAIETKAEISDRKTATAMQTASAAVRRANNLAKQLGRSKSHATVLSVERATGMKYPWGPLKKYYTTHSLPIIKVNGHEVYGEVNTYSADAWKDVYNVNIKKLFT